MTTSKIILNPLDKRLYGDCEEFHFNTDKDTKLAEELANELVFSGQVSLSANQIGYNVKLIGVRTGEKSVIMLCNPRVINPSNVVEVDLSWEREDCISHPGISMEVCRLNRINVLASTFSDHKERRHYFEGYVARAIQHSYDHLRGKLITDLGPLSRGLQLEPRGQTALFRLNLEAS